ncbi:c-type cytochrome [Stappia stellulata]|uniref:c-type cytochrome n=1 Tax=Stappia stellulata TaxID=71235 RepID=UPI00041D90AC|nr:cytochrome c [Stappia stellulata]
MVRRKSILLLAGVVLLTAAGALYLTRPERVASVPDRTPDLANGEAVFWTGGCASCHAAPGASGDDKRIMAGGLALKTPFGTFNVPNISSSAEHGIGGWTTEEFLTAMVEGTSPDGRHYYPAFPYTSYRHMSGDDLVDLKGFLDTLPASDNTVAGHDLAFPYAFRPALGFWKLLYLDAARPTPPQSADDLVKRGAYLVTGAGHCAECHTPRDALGGLDMTRWLAGGPDPEGGDGMIPDITQSSDGIADWSATDIAYYLESGFTPDYDSVGGSMTSVQENWARAPAADREAVAAYLKTLTPGQ